MMKRNLSLAAALSLALFGSAAMADDDMMFNVNVYLGTDAYDNSDMKMTTADIALIKAKSDFFKQLTYGIGGKFLYTMDQFGFGVDASYRMGKIDTEVKNFSNKGGTTPNTFVFKDADFSEFKAKAQIGYIFDMGGNAMLMPSIGLGYWSSSLSHAKDDFTTGGTTANADDGSVKLDLKTKLTSIPLGLTLRAGMGSDISFLVSGHYHYLFDAKSTTTRGVRESNPDRIGANLFTEYSHSSSSNLTSNYAMQFDVSLMKDLSGSEMGLDNVGLGFFWDKTSLVKSGKKSIKTNTFIGTINDTDASDTTYGPAKDAVYGAYITLGF